MLAPQLKAPRVRLHDFAMNPKSDVPRSQFDGSHERKIPFNFSDIVPIMCEMVLPGDTWNGKITAALRTAVPLVPVMDRWVLHFFAHFVPMRIIWTNAPKFWGEQDNPADSINYTIPVTTSPVGGYAVGSVYDFLGLPTVGQVAAGNTVTHNALPNRAYALVWNDWFRDENLQNSSTISFSDGPDTSNVYTLLQRGKRFDYINQSLPWPQKGNTAITLPIGTSAPVIGVAGQQIGFLDGGGSPKGIQTTNASTAIALTAASSGTGGLRLDTNPANTKIIADLSTATGATINALRTAIAMQQYLEKDARGGTRYNEFVYTHFGVRTADARLQRPEMCGGGMIEINTTAIPQTSATGLTGGTTPAGSLAASGYAAGQAGFTYSATEHGYLLVTCCATTAITFQQGLRRMFKASTRYDFPVPLLANLGEQALLNQEVYCDGSANDTNVFGYVPRWDEYRYIPNQVFGIFKSTAAGTIDYWHSAEKFTALPVLNSTYITDKAKTAVQRNFAAGAATLGQQIFGQFALDIKIARALPLYGIPGLTRL